MAEGFKCNCGASFKTPQELQQHAQKEHQKK